MADMRCVGAILYNARGEILLQLRDDKPEIACPNHWTTLGGQIEPGESPDEAVSRELLEEIEMAPAMRLWQVVDNEVTLPGGQVQIEQYFYSGQIDCEAEEITLHEGQAVRFYGRDDLEDLTIAFGFERFFRAFFEEVL